MLSTTIKVGVVGCGNISERYLSNITEVFSDIEIYACSDLMQERVEAAVKNYNIPHIMTLEEMLACNEIDIILNLTTPKLHYKINKSALLAGKHVYCEKPLALSFEEGRELCRLADERNLCLGCAPDTFMGAGSQTARKYIDDGRIGQVIGGNAFMMCHGHERWHPEPHFYYKAGGGPMMDMGPYYLTALVNILGAISEIETMNSRSFETRTITSEPHCGEEIKVEVPTHVCGLLKFCNGAICTITTSFDVWKHSMPPIELYGTDGSILVPNPNIFGGEVRIASHGEEYITVPHLQGYSDKNSRGIGLAEMADYILGKKDSYRASGKLALHVLEAMNALVSTDGLCRYVMTTRVERPWA